VRQQALFFQPTYYNEHRKTRTSGNFFQLQKLETQSSRSDSNSSCE